MVSASAEVVRRLMVLPAGLPGFLLMLMEKKEAMQAQKSAAFHRFTKNRSV